MTTPFDLYELWLYDHDGAAQIYIQNWTRVEFHQRLSSSWNHQITVEMSVDNPNVATYRNIQKDWILRIFRTDPRTLIKTKVYEGFNTTVVDQLRISGDLIFNLYGVGFTDLLRRRVVIPIEGEEHDSRTGNAETVIKDYVDVCMIHPVDTDRIEPGLTLIPSAGAGAEVIYDARYIILFSVCEKLSGDGGIDFGIYGGEEVGDFLFDARAIWGEDRRIGNTAGNIPVEFSVNLNNMNIPILSTNTSAEQNYVYIGGSGQGVDRIIEQVADLDAIADSPWGRKEFFADARQQTDIEAIKAVGYDELDKRRATKELSFNIEETANCKWLRDWGLGDLVSARYAGQLFDKKIVEIGVVVTPGVTANKDEVITVELENYLT
jgi:hypothetical protein